MATIAVVGSRDFTDYDKLSNVLDAHIDPIHDSLISGGARGADSLAQKYAYDNNISIMIIPADWDKYGKAAGPIRNAEIVEKATFVIAFWDGWSRGTNSTINLAKEAKKQCFVHKYKTGIMEEG